MTSGDTVRDGAAPREPEAAAAPHQELRALKHAVRHRRVYLLLTLAGATAVAPQVAYASEVDLKGGGGGGGGTKGRACGRGRLAVIAGTPLFGRRQYHTSSARGVWAAP